MNFVVIGSAFVLGLSSSLHCIGMCGPLIMVVPFPKNRQTNLTKLLYFIGKAFAYGIIGAIIGLFGIKSIWGATQQYLSIISGILILLMALFPYFIPKNANYPFQKTFQKTFHKIKMSPKWWHFFQLGALNGLLPCGMVYMALTIALASGGYIEGFLVMVVFGLGTIPALWSLSLIRDKITKKIKVKLKPIILITTLLIGILLILRGLNLGIPYISPKLNNQTETPSCH